MSKCPIAKCPKTKNVKNGSFCSSSKMQTLQPQNMHCIAQQPEEEDQILYLLVGLDNKVLVGLDNKVLVGLDNNNFNFQKR